MTFIANAKRYHQIPYNRCGNSGIMLPAISFGLWNNFGGEDTLENQRRMLMKAFDLGITHFDLANNYGPPAGAAEKNFGRILKEDFSRYRDEMLISTKAGFRMWDGPYGDWGSKKYLISSLDQSLQRMDLDYVDIFYHHRPDPETPLEETMVALDQIVRQGKALYVGISNYNAEQTQQAIEIIERQNTPFIIHQAAYSMLDRTIENGLTDILEDHKIGCIAYVPLAQGLLTSKYLHGIPKESRAAKEFIPFLNERDISSDKMQKIRALNEIALERGQTLAQMALVWVLQQKSVVSALIGASRVSQIEENIQALNNASFTQAELAAIDNILN
ncbi:L-glyceraldehyde 3-phosphate reductase [Gracilibacillus kekensis]|uniref:L-glyceraldehyde 3-phosphate reductase n=1 Tax=Gracilibacillus kekensis TaxID=1027249 RepID=A0A1M7QQ36_9BACI|nr:L-glyceraldehyde 3-phosphate reductase [Gracilibacillus kekensis]SHN33637.1 L-glyceraldehyde 3-phosphate reductase [Gracilibacillus kekensis]